MIRTYFGLSKNPFTIDKDTPLLKHQQRHFDIIKAHSQQGGLCILLGEPGTGKAVRDSTKSIDLKQLNSVLLQPHWRHNQQDEPTQSIVFTNQKPS